MNANVSKSVPTLLGIAIILLVVILIVALRSYQTTAKMRPRPVSVRGEEKREAALERREERPKAPETPQERQVSPPSGQ